MVIEAYHDRYACTGLSSLGELLVVHGWGMNSHVWDRVMPLLLERWSVTVVDLPGMGRSAMPKDLCGLEAFASHVLAVAPARAVWMGWSLGAWVLLRAASMAPARVESLITIGCNGVFTSRDDWPYALSSEALSEFMGVLEEDAQGTVIRFLALQARGSDTVREDIRFLRDRVFHDGFPATQALREGLRILAIEDVRSDLKKLEVPVLHILGERDPLIPAEVAMPLVNLSARSRFAIMSGAAHLPFVSMPEIFMTAIDDFFQGDMTCLNPC